MADYILYVNKDYKRPGEYDAGSAQCLALGVSDVTVEDVDQILSQGVTLPAWLDGTPVLVDVASQTAHKGSDAVEFLRQRKAVAPERKERGDAQGATEESDDPFESLGTPDAEITERTKGKVTEEQLQALIQSRTQKDERLANNRSGPTALPPALPANS